MYSSVCWNGCLVTGRTWPVTLAARKAGGLSGRGTVLNCQSVKCEPSEWPLTQATLFDHRASSRA